MIGGIGRKHMQQSTSSLNASAAQSTSRTTSAATQSSGWMGTLLGGGGSSTSTGAITDLSNCTTTTTTTGTGGYYIWPNTSTTINTQVGEVATLVKTGDGEFVLTGSNAQALLFEYFMQSPELWLRLAAMSSKEESNG